MEETYKQTTTHPKIRGQNLNFVLFNIAFTHATCTRVEDSNESCQNGLWEVLHHNSGGLRWAILSVERRGDDSLNKLRVDGNTEFSSACICEFYKLPRRIVFFLRRCPNAETLSKHESPDCGAKREITHAQ
ncbi:hypothetical protein EVAR_54972_1 [Eumeta japonica]|uniref:Uncharacterized protein n=1 Tax=Eumeta variegata TaxID=151549 RepID=A0A4C1YPK3_EUMVA|nr:hypothetical protein EVAR_54972_1 [Eumeta japonica]